MQNAANFVDVGQAYVVKACDFFGDVTQFKNVTDFFCRGFAGVLK